jgi:hypothetical protein
MEASVADEKLEAIRARLAAATPGPWVAVIDCERSVRSIRGRMAISCVLASELGTDLSCSLDDFALILEAPTDIAWLLKQADELAAIKEAAKAPSVEALVREIGAELDVEDIDDWSAGDLVFAANILAAAFKNSRAETELAALRRLLAEQEYNLCEEIRETASDGMEPSAARVELRVVRELRAKLRGSDG